MTEQMNVPKLRFAEFNCFWKESLLDNLASRGSGHTPNKKISSYYDGDIKWVSLADSKRLDNGFIEETETTISDEGIRNSSATLHPAGSVLLSRDAGVGKSAVMKENMAVSQHFIVWNGNKQELDNWFLYYKLQILKPLFERIAVGSTIKTIGLPFFKKLSITVPEIEEQQKIASFLSKVDEKISLLTEKKGKLTEYKKGVMQKLFSGKWQEQDGLLTFIPPTLRFKADDGSKFPDWEEKKLGQVFTRIRHKNKENNQNVLTISAQQGLINQEKYFNKSVAAKDVTGYYLLENGDFAYNKSYSKGYPMGAIKRLNNYDKGVVSTLYICFGLNKGFVSDFFEHYFESGLQNRDLSKIAQEGARNHGLLNISVDEFFKDVKLLTPSHDEQLKIANFLSTIDQKIDIANLELEKAKKWKKGLLQQMFV